MLSEMGINVIEDEEAEETERAEGLDRVVVANHVGRRARSRIAATEAEKLDRTDDPVRMYLREMGSVELLSREGEIAIAKRIEAGRNTMIAGLCESPLTFQAITIWRDELLNEDILLRDVIDLETTFGRSRWTRTTRRNPVVETTATEAARQIRGRSRSQSSTPTATRSRRTTTKTRTTIRPTCRLPRWRLRSSRACWRRSTGSQRITRKLSDMQDLRMSATLNEDGSFSREGKRRKYQQAPLRDRGACERTAPPQQPDRGAD